MYDLGAFPFALVALHTIPLRLHLPHPHRPRSFGPVLPGPLPPGIRLAFLLIGWDPPDPRSATLSPFSRVNVLTPSFFHPSTHPSIVLALSLTQGWFVSAGLIYALIPKLNFLSSLAVAACLTPTDPILAAAVVGGKYAEQHVPAHLRHLLAAESGCNDGAAFPFLYISLYLILDKSTGKAVEDWFVVLWLCMSSLV